MNVSESDIRFIEGCISVLSEQVNDYKTNQDEEKLLSLYVYSDTLAQRLGKLIAPLTHRNTSEHIYSIEQWLLENQNNTHTPLPLCEKTAQLHGKEIKFYSESNTEIFLINDPFVKSYWAIQVIVDNTKELIPVHLLFAEDEIEKLTFKPEPLFDILSRIKHFLGKAWNFRIVNVPIDKSPVNFSIGVIVLSPVSHDEAVKWAYEEEDLLKQEEIQRVSAPIIQKYNQIKEANTHYEDTLISEEESEPTSHSRFTWGEGFNEWDTWSVKRTFNRKVYYKGLFVKEEQIETHHVENNK